jgi:hypothetical protein
LLTHTSFFSTSTSTPPLGSGCKDIMNELEAQSTQTSYEFQVASTISNPNSRSCLLSFSYYCIRL